MSNEPTRPTNPPAGNPMNSSAVRWTAGVIAAIALIAVLRFKPWEKPVAPLDEKKRIGTSFGARQTLDVAFIPVTCHLTCPVTDFASATTTTGTRFDALRFTQFPDIVDSLKSKKLEAGFLTIPLAMKLREQGVPIKICCLGHRDGSQIVIGKDDPAKSLVDLKGKTIAIPSQLSNESFLFHKVMQDQGLKPDDIKFLVLPPPDMPTSLAAKAIDGFVVAEPFCTKAEIDGSGRVLYYGSDLWPHYISCCLVVHEDLIKEKPEVVRDLVRGIVQSGEWAEKNRADAAKLVAPYFRQDEKLLNRILTSDPARVTYIGLTPTDAEIEKVMDIGVQVGQLKKRTPVAELLDRDYIPSDPKPAAVDMTKFTGAVHP
ncbi:MAG TPA: ABC transporter substrate-binding protein [Chthonomonadaceae bacterium]|nr:ABC transporter substrate-binding protein [Chthonomonadaceae bacterium]